MRYRYKINVLDLYNCCNFASHMKKKWKNNIKQLLLITGLIILVHAILPHDHHFHIEHFSSMEHQHEHHSNKLPVHCHFFNDITIEKSNHNNSVSSVQLFSFSINYVHNTEYELFGSLYRFCTQHNAFTKTQIGVNTSPTRGSPTS